MKKTKKGVTLVELVICCAIIVMLGGACTALLIAGEHVYSEGSSSANSQMDMDVLQTYMTNLIPRTETVNQILLADAKATTSGNCIYFDDGNDGLFTIRRAGDDTTIRSIDSFEYSIVKAGDTGSDSARAQFVYTVTLTDDSSYSGGFVLGNMKYDDSTMGSIVNCSLADFPFYFSAD